LKEGAFFEEEDVTAGLGEEAGGDGAARPRSDHGDIATQPLGRLAEDVSHARSRRASRSSRRRPASRRSGSRRGRGQGARAPTPRRAAPGAREAGDGTSARSAGRSTDRRSRSRGGAGGGASRASVRAARRRSG